MVHVVQRKRQAAAAAAGFPATGWLDAGRLTPPVPEADALPRSFSGRECYTAAEPSLRCAAMFQQRQSRPQLLRAHSSSCCLPTTLRPLLLITACGTLFRAAPAPAGLRIKTTPQQQGQQHNERESVTAGFRWQYPHLAQQAVAVPVSLLSHACQQAPATVPHQLLCFSLCL